MYQAKIYFDSYEYFYGEGEKDKCDASWSETLTADTAEELKQKIVDATHTKWEDVEFMDINDYPTQSEYWAGYLGDEENLLVGDAEIEKWKVGKQRLWSVHAHILVSKLTKTKAVL